MKIQSAVITMDSNHEKLEESYRKESLMVWNGTRRINLERENGASSWQEQQAVRLDISDMGRSFLRAATEASPKIEGEELEELTPLSKEELKALLVEKMIEALTGKKLKILTPEKIKSMKSIIHPHRSFGFEYSFHESYYEKFNMLVSEKIKPMESIGSPQQNFGFAYSSQESYYEKETLSFESKGLIRTSNGREIQFSVQLNMSREFAYQKGIQIRGGSPQVDPLVINFDRSLPGLTDMKFSFDLDCDGSPDQISFAALGSGFLALDRNQDGVINNGSELFGPQTGSGFGELAEFDGDHNGWIDENDAIYDQLRIWTKDEQGRDQLFALGEKGIGAIYLGNVNTSFDMKNSENQLFGQMRSTGIFLRESGTVGTIHHIDLSI